MEHMETITTEVHRHSGLYLDEDSSEFLAPSPFHQEVHDEVLGLWVSIHT
jgi:hypothetical protein